MPPSKAFSRVSRILLLLISLSLAGEENYGRRILVPSKGSPRLTAAVDDLAGSLERMTGAAFTVEASPSDLGAAAIVVMRTDDAMLPEELRQRLEGAGPESYLLQSSDAERLWIVANHDDGLSHGIYDFLERLGCRWYYPNANWELIPERGDITLRLDEVVAPTFISRNFFGTGGFGPRNPVDPTLEMRSRWENWKRRNRFGDQLIGYGHVGHGFSIKYADALREHPDYRAMIKGERVEYRPAIKFCASNAEVLALFVEDRLREMRERVAREPESLSSSFVGADPSDSGGFCECEACRAIGNGSISDQVFHVANVVARAIAEEFPGRGVSMYAYGYYADLPSIDLEPNLHVTVIPYAFQKTGMTGDELLLAWGERIARDGLNRIAPLSLYTYWSITDWGRNLPDFDFRRTPPEHIRFWHDQGVRAIRFESTHSAGAIGLGLNLAVRLMWDPSTDTAPLIEEFYDRSFGPAVPPMRRMLERWAADFMLTRQELAFSFRDLEEGWRLADSDAVRARIGDYVQYVQYLRLWHTFSNAHEGEPKGSEAEARDLAKLLWRLYPSAMVHTYRLWQLLGYRQVAAIKEYFDPTKPDAPEWAEAIPPDEAELRQWIAAGVADYPLLGFEIRRFTGELEPLEPAIQLGEGFGPAYSSIHSTTFHLQVPGGMATLPVQLSLRHWHEGQEVKLVAYDAAGKQLIERAYAAPGRQAEPELHTIEIPVSGPGQVRIEIFDQKNGFTLRGPAGVPMVLSPLIPNGWARVYFYVPKGLRKLALYNPRRNVSASLFDPDGEEIVLEQNDALVVMEIPEGQDGRVWSIRRPGSSSPVILLNAPRYFALSPETMMIPADGRTITDEDSH